MALGDGAVRRRQLADDGVPRAFAGAAVLFGGGTVAHALRQRGCAAQAVGRGDGGVGEALLLPVPVHFPDAGVRCDETAGLLQAHQGVRHLGGDRGPPAAQRRVVVRLFHVLVHGPQEQAEAVELDVGAVLVRVGFLHAVAEVARDADLVREADLVLVLAAVRAELELDGLLGFGGVPRAREGDDGVGHVAHPGDVPHAGRQARQDLTVALAGFGDLTHAQDRHALAIEIRFRWRQIGRCGRVPSVPRRLFCAEQLLWRAPCDPALHGVDARRDVALVVQHHEGAGPRALPDADAAEGPLQPRGGVVHGPAAAGVVAQVRACAQGRIGIVRAGGW